MFGDNLLISSVFIAGLASFFAPCTFPVIPVYLGILTDADGEYKKFKIGRFSINKGAIIKTITFVLGLSTSFVILGFGAGFLGKFLLNRWVYFFAGLIIVLLGIHQMGLIHIKKLDQMQGVNFQSNKAGALGTYLLGISFSIGWTPCVGPILGAVILAASSKGTALYGGLMMLVYTLGLMIPFIVLVLFSDLIMSNFNSIKKHLPLIKRIGGGMVVVMGLVLMFNQVSWVTAFFERLLS